MTARSPFFARVSRGIEVSRADGPALKLKDEQSGEALTPVSRLGVSVVYRETARMSNATDAQLPAEVRRDGGSANVLDPC